MIKSISVRFFFFALYTSNLLFEMIFHFKHNNWSSLSLTTCILTLLYTCITFLVYYNPKFSNTTYVYFMKQGILGCQISLYLLQLSNLYCPKAARKFCLSTAQDKLPFNSYTKQWLMQILAVKQILY